MNAVELGDAVRGEWDLDPQFLTVNHGSYGATPRAVLDVQTDWRRQMEAQPTRFMGRVVPDALRAAAAVLAGFLGAEPDDVAFVENATVGCNAVLNALQLAPGDEILVLDHGYGAVVKAARHAAGRTGARVVEAPLPFPRPDDAGIVNAVASAITTRTRIAVLDHITSASALTLPLPAMAAICRAAEVPVLADGAHAPGNLDLDVPGTGADWYVGNCHKWLCAPKGAAFLWARRDRQAGLHPVTISHGYGGGFLAEFDWTGTRDMSAYLAVPAAIAFHDRLGGAALRARAHALANAGAQLLAEHFGTETGAGNGAPNAMALVRLPMRGTVSQDAALAFRERLLDARTDAPVNALHGAAWLRISAAPYNTLADFRQLREIVTRALVEANG